MMTTFEQLENSILAQLNSRTGLRGNELDRYKDAVKQGQMKATEQK